MNYLQIEFETLHEGESEILVALLADAGFESFEEEEKSLKAFIKEDGFEEDSLESVLKVIPVNYAITVVPQQNWNAQWESSFEPILVDDFVGIRADFHSPLQNVKHEIIITPKMSFGTGHHGTTFLMMQQMASIDFAGKHVLDFGTGTGVLAILAEKLGAAEINAIDNDEWSMNNAHENAAANNCKSINLHLADKVAEGKNYDIILANINFNVITANLDAIISAGKEETILLLSGFLQSDEVAMLEALNNYNIISEGIFQKSGWICIKAQKAKVMHS